MGTPREPGLSVLIHALACFEVAVPGGTTTVEDICSYEEAQKAKQAKYKTQNQREFAVTGSGNTTSEDP